MPLVLDLNVLASHCKRNGGIYPKVHCSEEGAVTFSVSGHIFQFPPVLTMLFTGTLPKPHSQISPQTAPW